MATFLDHVIVLKPQCHILSTEMTLTKFLIISKKNFILATDYVAILNFVATVIPVIESVILLLTSRFIAVAGH